MFHSAKVNFFLLVYNSISFPWFSLVPEQMMSWYTNSTHVNSSSGYIATNGQSAGSYWCQVPFGADDQILIFFKQQLLTFFFM
jgi:hypothetical protein